MPAPADMNVLGKFLDAYTGAINSGFGLISGDVNSVMGVLCVISIGLAAVFWMLDETENIMAPLIRQVLKIGFFVWIVNDWHGLTQTVIDGFAATGLKAGGSGVSYSTFLNNPGKIVLSGVEHARNEFNLIKELTGPVDFFINLPSILALAISAIGIIIAFFIIAVQLVVTLIEFRLVTLAAFILVPFGILNKTSFLAERSFGYVVSAGLKVLTIALIIVIGGKTFDSLALVTMGDSDSMFTQAMAVLLASLLLMVLALTIPSVASALVTGGPQLGAGAALAGAAGLAAGAGGAYLAGRGAMSALGKAAGAPAAIAAKAQAAAGAIREGAKTGIPPLGGAGRGTMGPAPGPSPSGGGGGAPSGGGSGGGTMPAGGIGGSGSGVPLDTAPTDRMRDTAQKIASEKGIEPPDMADGRAVRAFLNENSGADLGAYRPNASPPPTGVEQPSRTTGSAGTTSSAAAAAADSVPTLAANEGSAAAEASAPQSPPAPSTAPPPEITTARAAARSKAQRASRTTRAAQTAAAATSSQGGAGMTANIEHSEE